MRDHRRLDERIAIRNQVELGIVGVRSAYDAYRAGGAELARKVLRLNWSGSIWYGYDW